MASDLLTATLRHDYANAGNRWSGLIDPNVGGRLKDVKFSTACNAGFDTASATVLGLDGGDLLPEGEAASILYWWRFAVLRIYMRGESAWVGRIWEIELGPIVDDDHLGRARTVAITLQGIADDLAMRPAQVPSAFTEEDATTTVADLIKEAIDRHGSIIARNYDAVGSTNINIGQVSSTLGDYWLDLIVKALQTGDNEAIEWAFMVYEPEAGPILVPRGQGSARWKYPAVGAGVGVKWNGHEFASEVTANYTNASHSSEATVAQTNDEAVDLHHNISAGRSINVDGTSTDGATAAALTYLALHGNPVAPTGQLTIEPGPAGYAELAGPEGTMEPGWRVRAGQILDLYGLLPLDNRWRHMRLHNIEATEYDDDTGTLSITLDERRVRSRTSAQSVEIRRQWAALAPSRPRGTIRMFETFDDTYSITDAGDYVNTIGDEGQCVFTLPMDTEVKITFFGMITPVSSTGRLTLEIDMNGEGFSDTDYDRLARTRIGVASTEPISLDGVYRKWLVSGEHTLYLWAESQSGLAGSVLTVGRVVIEG